MKILLVDDHPMTVSGYELSLEKSKVLERGATFANAGSCLEFYQIFEKQGNDFFDLVIIDHGLPAYEEKGLSSGADLALLVREKHPSSKILMITAHIELLVVYDIYKRVAPDGLIIKNDLTPENLPMAVSEVLEGRRFLSRSVKKVVAEIWQKEVMVDDINRQIIFYLAQGYKIRSIEEVVPLSISPIQRRIALMKEAFGVEEETTLVQVAKKHGYL